MSKDKIVVGRDSQGKPLVIQPLKDVPKLATPSIPDHPDIKICEVRKNVDDRNPNYGSLKQLPQNWANAIGGTSKFEMPVAPEQSLKALEQLDGKLHGAGGQKPGDQVEVIKSNGKFNGTASVIKCRP
jgi:hypothetical protein